MITKDNELAIRSLLHHSDYVEEQNFPLVHKIILGISLKSLDDELLKTLKHLSRLTPKVEQPSAGLLVEEMLFHAPS